MQSYNQVEVLVSPGGNEFDYEENGDDGYLPAGPDWIDPGRSWVSRLYQSDCCMTLSKCSTDPSVYLFMMYSTVYMFMMYSTVYMFIVQCTCL